MRMRSHQRRGSSNVQVGLRAFSERLQAFVQRLILTLDMLVERIRVNPRKLPPKHCEMFRRWLGNDECTRCGRFIDSPLRVLGSLHTGGITSVTGSTFFSI